MIQISNDRNAFVSSSFTQADFYTKSKQSNKPASHEFDTKIIDAYEFLYQVLRLKYGDQAKPRFTSTLRIPGDSNYYRNRSKKILSEHSLAKAADANWNQHSQAIEDEIILILGYDIENNGPIWSELKKIGIGSIGTYYRAKNTGYTFIHMGSTNALGYYEKIPRRKLNLAESLHSELMELIKEDYALSNRLGISSPHPSTPVETDQQQEPTITEQVRDKVEETVETTVATATDAYNATVDIVIPKDEEDPISMKGKLLRYGAWTSIVIALLSFLVFLFRRYA